MLLTASLAVSFLLSTGPAAPPSSCEPAFTTRFPELTPVFKEAAYFRRLAQEGKTSFTDLVKQGAKLQKFAGHELERIQSAACSLEEEETRRFDACVSPVQWGCESVPPAIDWSLLKGVPKNEDEALAYALSLPQDGAGVDLLSDTVSFAGGCGDFGCAPASIALPALLGEPEKVERIVTLAARPGFFGQRALQRLEVLGSTLAKAKCEGDGWRPESPEKMKAVLEHLEAQRSALTGKGTQATRVLKALQRLAAALKHGLPTAKCKVPGD
jgi:hypothetical protein